MDTIPVSRIPATQRHLSRLRRRRLSVLLVNDGIDFPEGFADYLRTAGLEVATADDAAEALRMVDSWRPDVVVVDMYQSEPAGLRVVDTLRGRRETAAIPTILLAGSALRGEVAGRADICVTKPCSASALLSAVRILGGRA
jgi:CheY-like chemotaxis protein